MKRGLLRVALSLLIIPVLLAALWAWSRVKGPTPAQREALALMAEFEEPAGRNAFAALWTLPYDVPEEEQAAVVAEDTAYWREIAPYEEWSDDSDEQDFWFTHARGSYPDLRFSEADNALLCKGREEECLQRVRDDLEAYVELNERNSRLFERVAALSEYDYYRTGLPYPLVAPHLSFQYGNALSTRHTVWFVQGEWDAALDGLCRDLSTWRRLGVYSDSLLVRMIGIAFSSDGNARLLATMIAELPRDYPLPSSCELALAPPGAEELSTCAVMRGEFRLAASAYRELDSQVRGENWFERLSAPLAFDLDMTLAELAAAYAPSCREEARERVAVDEPVRDLHRWPGLWRLECFSNWAGCTLAEISTSVLSGYQLRSQDHGARLRLMGALLWLRDHAGDQRSLDERLAELPEKFVTPTRRPEVGEDGTALRIRQFFTQRGDFWEVPLPPYLHEAAPPKP